MEERFTCPVCLDRVAASRVTLCGHVYCGGCYYEMLRRSPFSACAVCRTILDQDPYPNFELDETLEAVFGDDAFRERARLSRAAAERAEEIPAPQVTPAEQNEGSLALLSSDDPTLRRVALHALLEAAEENDTVTCAAMQRNVLIRVVRCASAPETPGELEAAWRLLAHIAVYFRDAGVLLGLGVHVAAAHALVSPMAGVCSRRATTRAVESLSDTHPSYFAFFLDLGDPPPSPLLLMGTAEPWSARLGRAAPAALARVALNVAGGVAALARSAGALGHLLVAWGGRDRTLSGQLLEAALGAGDEGCSREVRQAAAVMLHAPVLNADALALVCWRDADAAGIISTCHRDEVAAAVRSASLGDNFDSQVAVLDFLHALHENAGMKDPGLVVDVLRWMRRVRTDEHIKDLGLSYVSACARSSLLCASAVSAAYVLPMYMLADGSDASLYLAGDVFSHEELVREKAEQLAGLIGRLDYTRYPAVYLVSSIAGTPSGLRIVAVNALETLCACGEGQDEVTAAAAQEVLEVCRGARPAEGAAGEKPSSDALRRALADGSRAS